MPQLGPALLCLKLPENMGAMTGAPMRRRRQAAIADVGARLLAVRTDNGISQQALADGAEVAVTSIRGWESGRRTPNATQLGRVVKWLRDEYQVDLYTYSPGSSVDPDIREKVRNQWPLSQAEAERVIKALNMLEQDEM